MSTPDVTQRLLAESAWIQRLARSLVRDVGAADDLAQETLIEAVTRPPAHASAPRGWLASVLRRRIGHRRRTEARRAAREERVARDEAAGDTSSTDERMRRHAELVLHTQALSEPYRSAIVLRYFDDLTPRDIAAQLAVPVTTVNSRIHRGLGQLRERLDAGPGGREEWLAALTVIGWPHAGLATSGSWIGVSVFMKSKVTLVAALLLVVGVVWFVKREEAEGPRRGVSALVESMAGPRGSGSNEPKAELGDLGASARNAIPSASELPAPRAIRVVRRGRVVDERGAPRAGVPVLHHGRTWPRWQSGDLGWITDGLDGTFLPPARVAALRADPTAADALFSSFTHPRDWRAIVFGESMPERTTTSDADGRFEFVDLDPDEIFEPADEAWLMIAQGFEDDGTTILVVSSAVRVAGRVLDVEGKPISGARVRPTWSPQLAFAGFWSKPSISIRWAPPEMNTDDDGRYLQMAVPVGLVGVELQASAPGFEPRTVRPPTSSREDFDVVLGKARADQGLAIDGVVLDPEGRPAADAEVVFGRDRVRTDGAGRFAFAHVEPADTAALTAIRTGFVPVQHVDLVPGVRSDPARGRGLELRFEAVTRTLRGVVLDARGAHLAGVQVNVFDPQLLDVTFTPLEGRLGGWALAATTDDSGRFELGGLAPRDYRLRVWRPGSSFFHVTEPVSADLGEVTVQVPASAFFDRVRGRVASGEGALPKGLRVAVGYPVHVTRGGGGSIDEKSLFVDVAPDGTFELLEVPRHDAEIVVGTARDDLRSLPVEAIEADGTVEIDLRPRRVLRIVGRADGASATIVDASRHLVPVEVLVARARVRTGVLVSIEGEFPPCAVPTSAVSVVFQFADGTWSSAAIEDDARGVSRARLSR